MFVIYSLGALLGAVLWALPTSSNGAPQEEPFGRRNPPWAAPVASFGLVGLTLHLLGRPCLTTLALSLTLGPVLGIAASWLGQRARP